MRKIPYGRQFLDDEDVQAVVDVLHSDFLTTGPKSEAFEAKLKDLTNSQHAVVVSSGTAALHLSMLASGVTAGTTVIVPAVTFMATANAALYAGGNVVFADVDPQTGLMEEEHLSAALDGVDKVSAVLPVHLSGQTADMYALRETSRQVGAKVIEDACHALGTVSNDKAETPVGACAHSDACTFSFHPVKTIAMGEGGAVTTNDERIAEKARLLRSHGIVRLPEDFLNSDQALSRSGKQYPWYHEMQQLGYNYRASEIHCALGLSQLNKLEKFVRHRRKIADRYDMMLKPLHPIIRPTDRTSYSKPAWHLYQVLVDFAATKVQREELMESLALEGIGTQVHYIPVYRQPFYQDRIGRTRLSGAEEFYKKTLSLPMYVGMDEEDVDRVVLAVSRILRV